LLSRDKQQFCIMQQTCSFFAKYSSFCSFARSLCFVKEEILTLLKRGNFYFAPAQSFVSYCYFKFYMLQYFRRV